MVDKKKN